MSGKLSTYLRLLVATTRWKLGGALALIVLFSLTEGIGILLLLPTLEVAGLNLEHQGEAGRYARMVTGAFSTAGLHPGLLMLLGLFVVLVGMRALLGHFQTIAVWAVVEHFGLELRRRLYRAITNANWLFVSRVRASDFTHALTAELGRVGIGTYALELLAADLTITLLYLLIAFKLSAPMTTLVLICGVVMAIALRRRTRTVGESGAELSSASQSLYAGTIEHLQSLKTTKAYGAEKRNYEIFSDLSKQVAAANLSSVRVQGLASTWYELGSVTILAVVVYISVRILAVPPAAILILLLMFARAMPRFMEAQYHYRMIAGAMPSFANVVGLEHESLAAAESPASTTASLAFRRQIRLERVSFSYRQGQAAVTDLDLVISAGKSIALVGPSGAGKSTIADLIMGLLVPDAGRITIDDVALTGELARAWRSQIGYVAPDTFLFHDTIRANLLWAEPNATEDMMMEALKRASADDFVRALGAGLDTVVGDRGVLVSQGERQRLALARAFLRRSSLLILDEATNSVDSDNEARVLGAIEAMRGELTVILIAHRLSTIRWADLIYVVDGGTVVESGQWDSLVSRRDSRFRSFWEAQNLTA
jgi:ATP-binding cassette, subfamily C, bacterial